MGVMNTGSIAKALWPGVKAFFGAQYMEHKAEYPDVFKKNSSDKAYEELVALAGFGLAPVKPEGDSISYDSMNQFFVTRLTNVTVGLGFQITREAIEDNQYTELARTRSRSLAYSMRQSKETIAANVLNRAFTATYAGGDGIELCATNHPTMSGTFANELATSADLSGASLEQAAIDIAGFVDNRDNKINVMPRKLIVHRNDMFEAQRILKSALEYDTANNAINALKSMNVFPDGIAVNHYLTDSDAFFIITDCPDGMVYFQRRALELAPAENDYDTENARFKATERYVFGWGDPRGIFGSPGA